jgi:hypothetical protein
MDRITSQFLFPYNRMKVPILWSLIALFVTGLLFLFYMGRSVEPFAFRDDMALKYFLKKEEIKYKVKKRFNDWVDDTDNAVTGRVTKTLYPEQNQ